MVLARAVKRFVCGECQSVSSRWSGQCPDCSAWNTISEEAPPSNVSAIQSKKALATGGRVLKTTKLSAPTELPRRLDTGISELNHVLGGGLVPGSAILLTGEPGIGKSTVLIQLVANLARASRKTLYVSGEEADDQIRLRAHRLGLQDAGVDLVNATSLRDICATAQDIQPDILIVDSISTVWSDAIDGAPGGTSQIRVCGLELVNYAKATGTALILVGHVTKDGEAAGPRVLEHMVDAFLHLSGDRTQSYRILRANKNRFGATDEIGVFEMGAAGMIEVKNPSSLFLTERATPIAGAAVFPALEGTRPVLVEIQALVVRTQTGATPRRAAVGYDSNRLAMILAVLEARHGISFSTAEVYLAVSSGYRLAEPAAADFAVASALVSALAQKPLPQRSVFLGEIALSGEVRPVAHASLRLREAARLGFISGYGPRLSDRVSQIRYTEVDILTSFLDNLLREV